MTVNNSPLFVQAKLESNFLLEGMVSITKNNTNTVKVLVGCLVL